MTSADNGPREHCVGAAQWAYGRARAVPFPHTASASFALPADAGLLYAIARGPASSGRLELVQTGAAGDAVRVDITVYYYRQEVLDAAEVCRAQRGAGEHGISIWVSTVPVGLRGR